MFFNNRERKMHNKGGKIKKKDIKFNFKNHEGLE
jgi:hypothetical protein